MKYSETVRVLLLGASEKPAFHELRRTDTMNMASVKADMATFYRRRDYNGNQNGGIDLELPTANFYTISLEDAEKLRTGKHDLAACASKEDSTSLRRRTFRCSSAASSST